MAEAIAMATSSFGRPLVISDDEAAQKMLRAQEEAKIPRPIKKIDMDAKLESGRLFLKKKYSH
ncbi:MAG: hypothetical protein WCK39_04835 [Methanomassiliicoccales archaeon]